MTLPIRATPDDVRKVVGYLRTKPTGAEISEIKAALDSAAVDTRKLSAYAEWGFVTREQNKLRLDKRGRELSRAGGESAAAVFAEVLRSTGPYRSVLEWAFHQEANSMDSVEVAARWHEHFANDLGSDDDTVLRQVAAFFQLCEESRLGRYVQGRRGNPSRLDLDRNVLGQFIAEASLEPHSTVDVEEDQDDNAESGIVEGSVTASHSQEKALSTGATDVQHRVFISHGKNMEIVEQIKTMLELADLKYEIAVEEEETAIPVPEKVFTAMRNCTSAVICVTADDDLKGDEGTYRINENVLIEIGAAFVLYEKRVVLVWDRRIPVPSNLQGLYRSEFEGGDLSWSAGMKLMKAVSKFRKI